MSNGKSDVPAVDQDGVRWQAELLRVCIDSAPLGIAMFDRDLRYLAASRRFVEELRIGGQNVIGRSHYELFSEVPERWREIHRRCLSGATERCDDDPFVRADGTVEWYRWEIQPWYEASGIIGGLVLFAENISDRKRAEIARAATETAARRNAELLETTLGAMADAVIVLDAAGRRLFGNPAANALLGDRDDIGSPEWQQTYLRFLPNGVTPLPHEQTPIARALRGECFDNLEVTYRRAGEANGRHIVASGRTIRDASSWHQASVIVYRDVTEIRATERQLRESQKMEAVGQLTGGIAHDFNNLLTVITGVIDILADGVRDRPDLVAIIKLIDAAATRGAKLNQHLLAFARRQPLQPRETDVNELVRETTRLLRPLLGEHIEIDCAPDDDIWRAMIDPNQLSTALLNLALNARDAMSDGGKITFATRNIVVDDAHAAAGGPAPGSYVKVIVSDTGAGIPETIRDQVFEPFFTTKGVGRGTGLGLSMVYGFIKQSRGHVEIASPEGSGTTISLYLPRCDAEGTGSPQQAPSIVPEGGTETILVVEDDVLVRSCAVTQLQQLGYRSVAVGSGLEALAFVDAGADFALLFTDVVMPGPFNGRQLAEEVIKRRPSVKVLFTSGYAEEALAQHGSLDPSIALLTKPYHQRELAMAIRAVLDGR